MVGFGASPLELMATDAELRGEIHCEGFAYSAAWITGTNSALGASATVDVPVQINNDSDFIVQEINLTSWSAANTIINEPDYLLTLIQAGSGAQIMNQAQHVLNYCGSYDTDRVPGRLSYPILLDANGTLTCTLQNRSAVAANRVDLAFRGFKVFYDRGNREQIFRRR